MLSLVTRWLPDVIALLGIGVACFVLWKMARRWRDAYQSALALRARLESEASAAAALRAQLSQSQVVNANPTFILGSSDGSGVLSDLRDAGRTVDGADDFGVRRAVRAGSADRLDRVEEVARGPAADVLHGGLSRGGGVAGSAVFGARGLDAGPRAAREYLDLDCQEELSDYDLPGMWTWSNLRGGWSDE